MNHRRSTLEDDKGAAGLFEHHSSSFFDKRYTKPDLSGLESTRPASRVGGERNSNSRNGQRSKINIRRRDSFRVMHSRDASADISDYPRNEGQLLEIGSHRELPRLKTSLNST